MGLDVTFNRIEKDRKFGRELLYLRKPWQYFIGFYAVAKDTDEENEGGVYSKPEMGAILMDASMGTFTITKIELVKGLIFAFKNTDKKWSHPFSWAREGGDGVRKWEYFFKIILLIIFGPIKMNINYCN